MTALTKRADLRKELSNPAIGSNHHLQKLAISLLDELEARDKHIAELEKSRKSWAELAGDIEQMRKQWADSAIEMGRLADEKDKRIAELEARTITVKFEPIPMEELGNCRDGKKHPYMFGAGYNSAVVHCESVLHQACAAAGIGVKGE
ncbi:hypothetical protein I5370_21525 [Citrobacter sp. FDAARGOS_156]|uniref:hypothetical protein n=1 Tax=Citrobacter sp. FDAARGOS_156 TaxID=1702170 RepID=UPI00190127E9|nr:hypothetical protein [Citrobacter sp. FDAARGOS_156]MBJ8742609.1 hypothetical protein [Citrobacter sp. FDAARGOS_156]